MNGSFLVVVRTLRPVALAQTWAARVSRHIRPAASVRRTPTVSCKFENLKK